MKRIKLNFRVFPIDLLNYTYIKNPKNIRFISKNYRKSKLLISLLGESGLKMCNPKYNFRWTFEENIADKLINEGIAINCKLLLIK